MKKTKSLEKVIHEIMMKYHFDPYNKQLYIKNCTKAIIAEIGERWPEGTNDS